jgi:hypothetical protein
MYTYTRTQRTQTVDCIFTHESTASLAAPVGSSVLNVAYTTLTQREFQFASATPLVHCMT